MYPQDLAGGATPLCFIYAPLWVAASALATE